MRFYSLFYILAFAQACNMQNKDEQKGEKFTRYKIEARLVGEWLSYRTENFIADKNDFFGKGDSLQTFYSVKERYEFDQNGKGRELTLSPDEVFSFDYKVRDSLLSFYDRKYKIEKVTNDTLILAEFDEEVLGQTDPNLSTKYQGRVHFKRVK
jgi:hypothetical protein